ncbi:UNVERIFIED_CONTAM: putative 6-phosphogluconolactonase 4, chloroplastic [Sesamum calycinum]|uniref:Probable 6-phosphogluconolactonase n=1 Tax=Sesamum calycinum TaxID=2727403 RepID=A0AAW2LST7_9LAMI
MAAKTKTEVLKFDSEEDVAVALAKYTADLSEKYVKQKDSFSVVLSGGTLIDTLSNYLLAYRGFLSKVPIPTSNIYAVNDKKSPEGAADDYEERLKHLVKSKILPVSDVTGFPKFDLMLLGMGPDGHVASLFPSRQQRYEKKRWVTFITDSPKPPPPRITFTFPVINSASEIAMVITGADLADTTKITLGDGQTPGSTPLPCCEVSAEEELTWFLDKDAASKL